MTDPLTTHARRQPGIATYPTMLGTPPVRPWIPLRDLVLRATVEPTAQPATDAVEPLESPPPVGRTPEGSEAISDGYATGGPLPAGEPVLLGEGGCDLTLDIDTSAIGSITIAPPDPEAITAALLDALRAIPARPVARIDMHPDLIVACWQRAVPVDPFGPGQLSSVPIAPDPSLPSGGWRAYDRDGQVLAQHPPAELPERTCPAGHTGPLPEVPPESYGPDAVPLPIELADPEMPAAEIHVPGRRGHLTRVWETVGAGWIWSCPECDARGVRLPDQATALTAAIRHAKGPLPWWRRLLDRTRGAR